MAMAIMLVAATLFIPILWKSVNQLAVFANALPPIVLGPLLLATMPRSEAPVVLSALVVTLTLFISLSTGLATTQAAHRDYFTVAGASRLTRMYLEVPSAIPTFVDGLENGSTSSITWRNPR
jgi:ABC-type nitrate/sulfonate/bicarbonate transport system permease component